MARDLFADPDILPGRGVDQPYAGLIRLGLKTLETRLFQIHKRGTLIVCATRRVRWDELRDLRAKLVPSRVSAEAFDVAVGLIGCAVAQAEVVGCRRLRKTDWDKAFYWDDAENGKRWAWELERVAPVQPIAVSCMPGFFPIPRERIVLEAA